MSAQGMLDDYLLGPCNQGLAFVASKFAVISFQSDIEEFCRHFSKFTVENKQ